MAPGRRPRQRPLSDSLEIRTLTDGGQSAVDVAKQVASFLEAARRSLDLAQYDFNLGPETREVVGGAILGIVAQAFLVVVVIGYVMPW